MTEKIKKIIFWIAMLLTVMTGAAIIHQVPREYFWFIYWPYNIGCIVLGYNHKNIYNFIERINFPPKPVFKFYSNLIFDAGLCDNHARKSACKNRARIALAINGKNFYHVCEDCRKKYEGKHYSEEF
jgi:hypothetical protein